MEACPSGMLARQNWGSVFWITRPFLPLIRHSPQHQEGFPVVSVLQCLCLCPAKMPTCGYLQKEQDCLLKVSLWVQIIFFFAQSASPEGCATSRYHYKLLWPQAFMICTPGIANLGSATWRLKHCWKKRELFTKKCQVFVNTLVFTLRTHLSRGRIPQM